MREEHALLLAPMIGRGKHALLTAGPGLPATPAEESQGPGVKPFTPDSSGPSGRDSLAT